MKDYRFILPAQMTPSEAFGLFLQRLRETGTELPASNANIASMIGEALDEYTTPVEYDDNDDATEESMAADGSRDTLARDMEVIANILADEDS